MHKFQVGEWVTLPEPFSDVLGQVIDVYGTGPRAQVTVEYRLNDDTSETSTKRFLALQLTVAAVATA